MRDQILVFLRYGIGAGILPDSPGAGAVTLPVEVQGMMRDPEFQKVTHHILNLLNTGVAKFQHFTTIHADEVVVLLISVGFFVLREVFPELVFFFFFSTDQ